MTKKKAAVPPAPASVALDTGRIEQLRIDQLAVSPLNVRKDAEVGPDDELVHSIRAHGLLQPLIGYLARSGMAMVLVCAGQRRLLALQHIAAPDTKVPVRIVDEQTAIEVSLAENLERKSMNPADELAAFNALIETGAYDGNRIADRFGFDRRYVRRRLKMAVLHPDILAALRDGTIGVSSAEAYAATDDHELQLQIFGEQSKPNSWNPHAPDRIVEGYSCAGVAADTGLGKFIGGVEAYEAAGGSCARDDAFSELFAENAVYRGPRLIDAAIVRTLFERAQAEHQESVEKLARDQVPFADAALWCDAKGNAPKVAKDSGLALVRTGWVAAEREYRDEKRLRKLAEKVAKAGGQVAALVGVGREGAPEILDNAFLMSKAALEAAAPKKTDAAAPGGMSAEDRAKLDRERAIKSCAINLYGRSLVGETPGFVVTRVTPNWQGGLIIELAERRTEKLTFSDLEKLAEPFIDQATGQVDAALVKTADGDVAEEESEDDEEAAA